MLEILIGILILNSIVIVALLIKRRKTEYAGTMYVHKDSGGILYSLELDDDPEKLEFKKVIVFRVKASKERLDRE